MSCSEDEGPDLVRLLESITFSSEVQGAIDQVLPSKDPLDQADLNIVDYINSIFPTEQSLNNIDDVIANLESKIVSIEEEMRSVIRGQTNITEEGQTALEEARRMIRQLLTHADRIRQQAEASEESVREITQDIKELDTAKRNLTTVITTLNHLHMLLSGVEALQTLSTNRLYGEIILPLQGVTEVMEHFRGYLDIPQVAQLSNEVQRLRVALAQQITADFHLAFGGSGKQPIPLTRLADAAKVVSILDPQVRTELLNWFQGLQLAEYLQLFHESQDCAWLDKIDKRYAWFKRHLLDMEEKFGTLFPAEWEVSERLSVEFCRVTRNELSKMMHKRAAQIDVKLLIYAIQRTENFENLLARRFSGTTLRPDAVLQKSSTNPFEDDAPDDELTGDQSAKILHPFCGLIGQCFEPHLPIYVDSLDRNLADLMERFVTDTKQHFATNDLTTVEAVVLPSCADLFVFYKKCLVQCSQLSTSNTMLALCHTFQKYLREYGVKVLQGNLPKVAGGSARGELAAGFIQTLLREGEATRLETRELRRVCAILITAEYCADTVAQLEEKLKEKITETLSGQVSLADEQDLFNLIIGTCLQLLVQDLDAACDAALAAMTKMNWSGIDSVGDQSAYVSSVVSHLKTSVPLIRDQLSSSRKYFTKFCAKFANVFIAKFVASLYKCRGVSTVGAEQLLLDTHSLKTVLLEMPSISSQIQRKPPPSYTKAVIKGMGKAEMILKVVMSPAEPERAFVDQVLRLLPELEKTEFQKLVEMKFWGMKRSEQQGLLELYRDISATTIVSSETEGKSLGSTTADYDTNRVRKLEKLITGK